MKTSQKDNLVLGDQAARDINKKYVSNFYDASKQQQMMNRLIELYRRECELNRDFCGVIEKLEHYSNQVDERIKGLEEKLKDGNQENLLEFAENTKELFVKKLTEFQFYESAQKIFAFLLAEIYSKFHRIIYLKIKSGITPEKFNEIIQSDIIEPIQDILCENILDIYADEINGMLYFLTGNCHIKWS